MSFINESKTINPNIVKLLNYHFENCLGYDLNDPEKQPCACAILKKRMDELQRDLLSLGNILLREFKFKQIYYEGMKD